MSHGMVLCLKTSKSIFFTEVLLQYTKVRLGNGHIMSFMSRRMLVVLLCSA